MNSNVIPSVSKTIQAVAPVHGDDTVIAEGMTQGDGVRNQSIGFRQRSWGTNDGPFNLFEMQSHAPRAFTFGEIVTRGLKDLTEPWWLVRTGSESPASLTLSAVGSIFPVNGSVAGSFSEVTL